MQFRSTKTGIITPCFYLEKRADCPQLFVVIVTSYTTNKKEIREKYESYRQTIA
jgi:hypothetical protein